MNFQLETLVTLSMCQSSSWVIFIIIIFDRSFTSVNTKLKLFLNERNKHFSDEKSFNFIALVELSFFATISYANQLTPTLVEHRQRSITFQILFTSQSQDYSPWFFHAGGFTDITLYTCTTHRKETWELVQSVASPQYNYQSFQTFLIYSVTSEDVLGL